MRGRQKHVVSSNNDVGEHISVSRRDGRDGERHEDAGCGRAAYLGVVTLVLFGGGGRALVFALKRKGSGAATKMRGAKR